MFTSMIHQYTKNGRIIKYIFMIKVVILERLAWCIPEVPLFFLDEPKNASTDSFEAYRSDESFTINTVGCIIPTIGIEIESIRKYTTEPEKRIHVCRNYEHRLLESNQTHIWTIKENYHLFKINNESEFTCCYESFYRPQSSRGIESNNVDNRIQYLGCYMFQNFIEVNNEFVKVHCLYKKKPIYEQYFMFTPRKQFTFNRDNPFKMLDSQSSYNVIIMGLGSMSRKNFYRTMPNTLDVLKKYNAVELKGYNTVANGTFQNMISVLVGMNISELCKTCWPRAQTTLDSCPFIWERFKDVGYYTALVEDTARYGIFNKNTYGFRGSPTDYYLHPFMYESENHLKRAMRIRLEKTKSLKTYLRLMREFDHTAMCMGDKYYFEVLLDYVDRITTTMRNSKLFGLFWETSMSHDNLNYPLKMDSAYVTLIKKLESTGYLNDTILLFLSDHGMDIGDIRLTKQGRIEQRLPFVFILTPPSFRKQYRLAFHNLRTNKGRLTTPFDIHQTLIDLINLNDITEQEILKRSKEFYTHNRGISLFLQVPRNRSCEMAGIHNTWCTCYNDIKLSGNNPILIDAVHFLTRHINKLLHPYPECLKLIADEIIVGKEMVPVYEKSVEWRDFNVILRMAPGGGIYDAMLRYNKRGWTLVDRLKRLNFPGIQSLCLKDAYLRLFCHCK